MTVPGAKHRVVVVGNGMAGCRFVQELLERDPSSAFDITVVGDEHGGAYNRVLLSSVLAGLTRPDAIDIADPSWYAARGVALHAGRSVVVIDRIARAVILDDSTTLPYDTLVLATGSTPLLPPIDGIHDGVGLLDGIALFRTRADCVAIDSWAADARHAVVVGAGVLGLEAARALAGRGLAVTVVQREDRLMERQLDAPAARVLDRTLRALGIEVRAGVTVARVRDSGPRVNGVALSDGVDLAADLVVLCCGVRPRVDLARNAGLEVGHGIVVDDALRSVSDEHVFAIGECAEHRGRLYGLVAPVWEQARVAAAAISNPAAEGRYTGSTQITRLKAAGIELAAMGDQSPLEDVEEIDGTEFVSFVDRTRGVYQKLIVRDGRLVAAILLGDTRNAGSITQLFERGANLPVDRSALLMVRRNAPATTAESPTALPARATICQCNGVTKATITAAWQAGAQTVEELATRTRATTGCGTCRDAVCGLVEWLADTA